MEFTLTENQSHVKELIESTPFNYAVLGKPGVGKSVLIRALLEGKKRYTLAAPTGLAALNIGGRTLHSIFRLPISQGIIHPTFNNFTEDDKVLNMIKYNIRTLIIDECSMVRCDMFDFIDRLMRHAKGSSEPFGGAQVIAVGDFFQLPPVVVGNERKQLKEAGYESEFIFSSHVWKNNFRALELSEVLRQKGDTAFLGILHNARTGNLKIKDAAALNQQVRKAKDLRITLTGTNVQADQINGGHLRAIAGDPVRFVGVQYGKMPDLPVPEQLDLKVGAQVMVKMNGADRPEGAEGDYPSKVVNGTIGKIVSMSLGKVEEDYDPDAAPKSKKEIQHVVIEMERGGQATIYRRRWEHKIKEKSEDGRWEERVVASYEQIPVSLAWAISIHKSQGQSFDKMHIDANKIFAPGQLYVAMSRCRSLKGLTFEQPVRPDLFWPSQSVMKFFEDAEENLADTFPGGTAAGDNKLGRRK